MTTLAIVLSGTAVFISGVTLLAVLTLLGRKGFQYPSREDLEEVQNRQVVLGANQSKLWRYLEAIDDRLGSTGHRVLSRGVPRDQVQAGD